MVSPFFQFTVDHINRDPWDNRRENLRYATAAQQAANTEKCFGKSKFKGVSWDTAREQWRVECWLGGKRQSGGYFDSETDAARAYDQLAREAAGEFAFQNFPA